MKIAIYDLDKTVTRRSTYTPFLMFAARTRAPWRLALLPLWLAAMLAHVLGVIARRPLKAFGFRLLVGRRIGAAELQALGLAFARRSCASNIQPGATRQIAADRAGGARLVLATAAPDFYAREIGALLGFDAVIASTQARESADVFSCRIEDENCYGDAKLARIKAWLAEQGINRAEATIAFYSDHASDAPTLAWADHGHVINPAPKLVALARAQGWGEARFS